MAYKQINSLKHLKKEASDAQEWYADFFILLAGIAKSGKRIHYHPEDNTFDIINEIDDSFEELTEEQLKKETMIYEAIQKGAFYKY